MKRSKAVKDADAGSATTVDSTTTVNIRLPASEKAAFLNLCKTQGVTPSKAIRRLIRQANGLGPTLDKESAAIIRDLTAQTRSIGINVNQWTKAMNRGLIPRDDQVMGWLKNVGTVLDESLDMYVSICVKRGSRARQVMNGAVFEALVIDPQTSDLRK